jgi:hypothetical protein
MCATAQKYAGSNVLVEYASQKFEWGSIRQMPQRNMACSLGENHRPERVFVLCEGLHQPPLHRRPGAEGRPDRWRLVCRSAVRRLQQEDRKGPGHLGPGAARFGRRAAVVPVRTKQAPSTGVSRSRVLPLDRGGRVKKVCAWCKKPLDDAAEQEAPVSHGICNRCASSVQGSWVNQPRGNAPGEEGITPQSRPGASGGTPS